MLVRQISELFDALGANLKSFSVESRPSEIRIVLWERHRGRGVRRPRVRTLVGIAGACARERNPLSIEGEDRYSALMFGSNIEHVCQCMLRISIKN